MFDKIKTYIGQLTDTVKNKINAMSKPIKAIVVSYFAVVIILIMTAYLSWVALFYQGKATLNELIRLLDTMVGAPMVAFVTFIVTCFVDKDNDGIPDKFEDKGAGK